MRGGGGTWEMPGNREKCRLVKDLKALIRDPHGLLFATWRDMQARFFSTRGRIIQTGNIRMGVNPA